MPLLEEIHGEGSMNNLSNLAVESDQARAELLQSAVLGPFVNQVDTFLLGIAFHTLLWKKSKVFSFGRLFLAKHCISRASGCSVTRAFKPFMEREHFVKLKEGVAAVSS